MKARSIGGSILPSSSPQILEPMPFRGGVLQVVPDREADTHRLTIDGRALASHANGFSCHALAERMIAGDAGRVREQACYIVRCGGSANLPGIDSAMEKTEPSNT